MNALTTFSVIPRAARYFLPCSPYLDFIKQLQMDAKKQDNVAITSSILNLIDEVENNLIRKQDAYDFYMMNIRQQKKIAAGREKDDVFWTSTGNQWMEID